MRLSKVPVFPALILLAASAAFAEDDDDAQSVQLFTAMCQALQEGAKIDKLVWDQGLTIESSFRVCPNQTLSIKPGVNVSFKKGGALNIEGRLEAEKVTFQGAGYKAGKENPDCEAWKGIRVEGKYSAVELSEVTIACAQTGISANGSKSVSIHDSKFKYVQPVSGTCKAIEEKSDQNEAPCAHIALRSAKDMMLDADAGEGSYSLSMGDALDAAVKTNPTRKLVAASSLTEKGGWRCLGLQLGK